MVTYCGALGGCGVSGGGQLARTDLTVGIKQMCAMSLCCVRQQLGQQVSLCLPLGYLLLWLQSKIRQVQIRCIKITFNLLYLRCFFTKTYVRPLIRIVSMRRFLQVVKHRIW